MCWPVCGPRLAPGDTRLHPVRIVLSSTSRWCKRARWGLVMTVHVCGMRQGLHSGLYEVVASCRHALIWWESEAVDGWVVGLGTEGMLTQALWMCEVGGWCMGSQRQAVDWLASWLVRVGLGSGLVIG